MSASESTSFFLRHEFAIRRIHSLLGIVPLGLYMFIHLATNASLLNGPATFQRAVFQIHSLGNLLPLVEWLFILLPLLFHAIIGIWISTTSEPNNDRYPFGRNRRYTWQRWTGMLAFVFLFAHVLHLHGWFHFGFWVENIAEPFGLARFRPYNAASSLGIAMSGYLWPAFYLIGVLACIYHLANGLWTAGITWGLWLTPAAQARASKVCMAIGLVLVVLGTGAWLGAITVDETAARAVEDRMYEASVEAGMIPENEHKRESDAVDAAVEARMPAANAIAPE